MSFESLILYNGAHGLVWTNDQYPRLIMPTYGNNGRTSFHFLKAQPGLCFERLSSLESRGCRPHTVAEWFEIDFFASGEASEQ